jgi:transketolase
VSAVDEASRESLRKAGPFGTALLEVASRRPDVVALSADVSDVTGLAAFAEAFPDRFVNVGMAEQNLVMVAAGLAKAGYTPVITTFAAFATRRALDFIALQAALNRANITVVAALPGIYSTFGPTHQGIEDLAHMRALPNLTVIDPCDNDEMAAATTAAIEHPGPVYLRQLLGRETEAVGLPAEPFRIGPAQLLRDGRDVGIVASSIMVRQAMLAAAELDRRGVSAAVLKVSTLKPFDSPGVAGFLARFPMGVTAENHTVLGGLHSATCEALVAHGVLCRVAAVGIADEFCSFGSNSYVAKRHGLTSRAIVEAVLGP